jgi:hypothetical protein
VIGAGGILTRPAVEAFPEVRRVTVRRMRSVGAILRHTPWVSHRIEAAAAERWFCVRTVLCFRPGRLSTYEERLTLWWAVDAGHAMELAEAEARGYAGTMDDCELVELAQAYELRDEPGHGAEIFSLQRDSRLDPDEYVNTFFETGREIPPG